MVTHVDDSHKSMRYFFPENAFAWEEVPQGQNGWINYPDVDKAVPGLFAARAIIRSGMGHNFHRHPEREEIIYVLQGVIEQWIGEEHQLLAAGDATLIPAGLVHASFNVGEDDAILFVVLSSASGDAPLAIDVSTEAPWNALRQRTTSSD